MKDFGHDKPSVYFLRKIELVYLQWAPSAVFYIYINIMKQLYDFFVRFNSMNHF